MNVIKAIYTILSGASAVTDLVSTRIYSGVLGRECTYPAVRIQLIDTDTHGVKGTDNTLGSGASIVDVHTIQVDTYAVDTDTLISVTNAIRTTLDRYPHSTVSSVVLDGIEMESAGFMPEEPDAVDVFRFMQIFNVRTK